MKGKYPKFSSTGVQRFKQNGKFGNLSKYETKLKPFQFGYGTIYATSKRGAKIKLNRAIEKDRLDMQRIKREVRKR